VGKMAVKKDKKTCVERKKHCPSCWISWTVGTGSKAKKRLSYWGTKCDTHHNKSQPVELSKNYESGIGLWKRPQRADIVSVWVTVTKWCVHISLQHVGQWHINIMALQTW